MKHRIVPWRITFDTNPDDCNLQCIMCEQHSKYSKLYEGKQKKHTPPRRMPIELIKQVLDQVANKGLQEIIPSTMGEPLLYKDFDTIVDYCYEYNLKLNLTTNGTFPKRGVTQWGREIVPIASDVKISWNGAMESTQELIMEGTSYPRGLQNIKEFVRIRDEITKTRGNYCCVTLQITFMENNIAEIPKLIELASKLGIDRIKGHHLWVHFPEIEHLSLRRNAESIAKWNQMVELAHKTVDGHRLISGKKIKLSNFVPLIPQFHNAPLAGKCPFLGQEAWISATGRFDPCCAPDVQRRTLGFFGNLYETDFLTIWNRKKYKNLLQNYLLFPLCQQCLMKRPVGS